jgi:hypothetical protein
MKIFTEQFRSYTVHLHNEGRFRNYLQANIRKLSKNVYCNYSIQDKPPNRDDANIQIEPISSMEWIRPELKFSLQFSFFYG